MIPPNRVLDSADLAMDQILQRNWKAKEPHPFALREVLDHVLVRLIRSVDSGLSSLDWQSERIHDDQRIPHDLSLHETHNLVRHTRPRMDNLENVVSDVLRCHSRVTHHLDDRHGGYLARFEIVGTAPTRQDRNERIKRRKVQTPEPKEPLG
jgi:hypothetical protein